MPRVSSISIDKDNTTVCQRLTLSDTADTSHSNHSSANNSHFATTTCFCCTRVHSLHQGVLSDKKDRRRHRDASVIGLKLIAPSFVNEELYLCLQCNNIELYLLRKLTRSGTLRLGAFRDCHCKRPFIISRESYRRQWWRLSWGTLRTPATK